MEVEEPKKIIIEEEEEYEGHTIGTIDIDPTHLNEKQQKEIASLIHFLFELSDNDVIKEHMNILWYYVTQSIHIRNEMDNRLRSSQLSKKSLDNYMTIIYSNKQQRGKKEKEEDDKCDIDITREEHRNLLMKESIVGFNTYYYDVEKSYIHLGVQFIKNNIVNDSSEQHKLKIDAFKHIVMTHLKQNDIVPIIRADIPFNNLDVILQYVSCEFRFSPSSKRLNDNDNNKHDIYEDELNKLFSYHLWFDEIIDTYEKEKIKTELESRYEELNDYIQRISNQQEGSYRLIFIATQCCHTCLKYDDYYQPSKIHEFLQQKQLYRCTGCFTAYYCSEDCQHENWMIHRKICSKDRLYL